ncbi:MAG TPA: hypothetical protein ACHBZA_04260 [Arsenophonus apicola]
MLFLPAIHSRNYPVDPMRLTQLRLVELITVVNGAGEPVATVAAEANSATF